MESRKGNIKPLTWDVQMRRYHRMERELISLNQIGAVSTTSPAKLTPADVKAYIMSRKEKNVGASVLNHDISALNQLLLWSGNSAVLTCLRDNEGLKPKNRQHRLSPLSENTYGKIMEAWEHVDQSDIVAVRSFALVLLYIVTGARNQELRLCKASELDTNEWIIHFENVKGKDTYGEPRNVPIPEEVRPIVQQYLMLRTVYLQCHKVSSDALFFALGGDYSFLSGNSIRRLKTRVEEAVGEKFEIRDCRRSFGQFYLNKGMNVEFVSRLMGHNTTKTTEEYYCRKNETDAINDARNRW